ncbi:AfsR/SARP family transcriptional regulator [Streptomyces sp. NPDC002446]
MRFHLIGPFEIITDDGRVYTPKAPKVSQLVALLALTPRETVATDTLIRELWGESPPGGALRTLQTHVYHARKMFSDERVTNDDRRIVVTDPPGYRVEVADTEVDFLDLERFVQQAQRNLDAGALDEAAEMTGRALELWRGTILSNVPVGSVLAGRIGRVEEWRIRALQLRIEIANRRGRQREHLPELRTLVVDYPLNEWFHGQLIAALYHSGRRSEALQAYQNLYGILKRELGLKPSGDLQRLQAEILDTADPGAASYDLRWASPPGRPGGADGGSGALALSADSGGSPRWDAPAAGPAR